MIENWEQFKDLEYYPDRVCKCGCGERIKVQSHHKYQGIPEYISGHNTRVTGSPAKRPEVRKVLSEQKIGDNNPAKRPEVRARMSASQTGKHQSQETKEKRGESLRNSEKFKKAMKTRKPPRQGTDTSLQARENMRNGKIKQYSNPENRLKKAKELASARYAVGHIDLPRLGFSALYRSSYEKIALLLLDGKEEVFDIQIEKVYIPYVDEFGSDRTYIPDFLVTLNDDNQFLIEVKPKDFVEFDPRCGKSNFPKFEAAQKWAKENDVIFCIWTEDILFSKNGVTTTSLREIVEATVANLFVRERLKV